MSYFQKHLKTISSDHSEPAKPSSTPQIAHKFKKNTQNKSKVGEISLMEEPARTHPKT